MHFALNHMTVPNMGYVTFLGLAVRLGCAGVELRNDLDNPIFDGISPEAAGQMAKAKGLRILGLSQVYPFNHWDANRSAEVRALIELAQASGAETINLIPRNDGTGVGEGERQANLRLALKAIAPMLVDTGITALIEPLGFLRSSLRHKQELVDVIKAVDGTARFKIVHDTFHHALSEDTEIYAGHTGIVHISGVTEPDIRFDQMEDAHRGLVDAQDRLGSIDQIGALMAAGYDGPISYECFAPATQSMPDPYSELKRSFDFISSQIEEKAA